MSLARRLFLNDSFILFLILLNALTIFLGGFKTNAIFSSVFSVTDSVITLLFICEVGIKLTAFGTKYFSSNWNKFDFSLIVLSIPALLAFILDFQAQDFSFLLVLRVLRVFKSFRFLKFIPGISHLISGFKRALKASVVVLAGFVIYIFIIGILSFFLFRDSSPVYFSNPLESLYTIFKIFTIEGWFEVPEQITSDFSSISKVFTYLYFIFVVLSGGIIGLSLVNSIFVDAMVSDNNDQLEEKINRLENKIDQLIDKS